jgi:hypothetical protein
MANRDIRSLGESSFSEICWRCLHFPSPFFNLFGKEIEAQRAGRLIKVDILALNLIALHKQLGF